MIFLAYAIVCLVFGTTFMGIKVGVDAGYSPFFFAGIRFFSAAILVLLFLKIKKVPFPKTKKEYLNLAYVGFSGTGMTFATLYWAEQYITSGLAALLSATGPLMIVILLLIQRKLKITRQNIAGISVGFVGVFILVMPSLTQSYSSMSLIGACMIILGEVFYSLGTIHSRKLLSQGFPAFLLNGFQMLFGGFFLLILSFLFELPFSIPLQLNATLSLLYLILIGSIVGHGLYYWLVKKTNPIFPSTWLYISPMIAIFVGAVVLQEQIHFYTIIGAFFILGGVLLSNLATLKLAFRVKAEEASIKK